MPASPLDPVLQSIRKRFGLAGEADDGILLQRFASSKDESAFASLVERHGALVWGTCRRVAGDAHDAEDAFQATWLVLARKAGSVKDSGSLPGWLHRVAFRLALAARARPTNPLGDDAPSTVTGPEDVAASQEARSTVDEEVNRLPDRYRLPVLLCFYEGRTHTEAAAELGWPVGTVASRIARAKDLLHARLTRRGLAPSAWPLPLAGAVPPLAKDATAAAALAAAYFAAGIRGRLLTAAALLLLPALVVLAAYAAPPARQAASSRDGPKDVTPEPELPPALRIPRNRMMHGGVSVAFSPDGRTLTSGRKLWDVRTNKELLTLAGAVRSVAYSPDGQTLASVGEEVKLWDAKTGKELAILKPEGKQRFRCVVYSPDGNTLAWGEAGGSPELATITLWDVKANKELATLKGHKREVSSVAFSPDGKTLASGAADGTVKLWDVTTNKVLHTLEEKTGHSVRSVAFSPDGLILAYDVGGGVVKLWDVKAGNTLATLKGQAIDGQGNYGEGIAFSPDGKTLASSVGLGVRLWDVAERKELAIIPYLGTVTSVAFSPDGKTLASASNTVKLSDVKSAREQGALAGGESDRTVAFSPDGKTLASGILGGKVELWDVKTGKVRASLGGYGNRVRCVAFSPDGKALAVGAAAHDTVKLWVVETGKELRTLTPTVPPESDVVSLAYSSDGKTLAAAYEYSAPRVWDVKTGKEIATLEGGPLSTRSMALSPDGKTLALAGDGDENTVYLWDVKEAKLLMPLQGHKDRVYSVAFSPDGKTLASGSWDGTVKLWDYKARQVLATLTGHKEKVYSVAYSPDGKTLAAGSAHSIKLWDVTARKESVTLIGQFGPVRFVAFSPDGKTLASGTELSILLWDVSPDQ